MILLPIKLLHVLKVNSLGVINSDQRLTKPLVRKDGEFHEVEWDEALDVIETNFKRIKMNMVAII